MFGALESEDLIAVRARDEHGVDLAHADGAKGFFQLGDASEQISDLRGTGRLFFPLRHFPAPHRA
jgi:hypothetical protein